MFPIVCLLLAFFFCRESGRITPRSLFTALFEDVWRSGKPRPQWPSFGGKGTLVQVQKLCDVPSPQGACNSVRPYCEAAQCKRNRAPILRAEVISSLAPLIDFLGWRLAGPRAGCLSHCIVFAQADKDLVENLLVRLRSFVDNLVVGSPCHDLPKAFSHILPRRTKS